MARKCINSCDRLSISVAYLIVGILQLSAGLVLLKSKYVSLLSAPNFWTAASNLSVAGLIAASVSVWKNVGKNTAKDCVRRNLIASLVFSAMIINGVTFAILFLDESHTLLSIHLEDKGVFTSKHFMSEVLGYAYAASLWMPIICIAISSCFLLRLYCKRKETGLQTSNVHKLTKTPEEYEWVFKSKNPPMPDPEIMKKATKNRLSSSCDSSDWSDDDDVLPIRSFTLESTTELGNSQNKNLSSDGYFSVPRISRTAASHLKSNTKNQVSFADDTLSIKSRRNKFNQQTKRVSLKELQQIMKSDGTFQLSDLQNFKKPRLDLTFCKTEKMFTRIEHTKPTSMNHAISESRTQDQDITHVAEIHADGSFLEPNLSDDIFENFSRDLLFSPYPKVRRTSTTKSLNCFSENEHAREDESLDYSSGDECPDNQNYSNLSLNTMNHSAQGDETLSEEHMHGNIRVRVNSVFDMRSSSKSVPFITPQAPEISSHKIVSKNLNENTVYKESDSANFSLRNVDFSSFKANDKIRRKNKLKTNVTNASYDHCSSRDLQHFSKVKDELLDDILKTDLSHKSEPSILGNNLSHLTSGYVSSLEGSRLSESNKKLPSQNTSNPAASYDHQQ